MRKKTKIVCTIGPAVDSESTLTSLIVSGMDIARYNFSHGTQAAHLARMNRLKKVRRTLDSPCAIMMDTRGPEIRTGTLKGGKPVRLQAGKRIVLTEEPCAGTARRIQQTYPNLAARVRPGTPILIDDGAIELAVDEVAGRDIVCTVQNTGVLGEQKSVNLPETELDLPALTEQDKSDLLFGIEQGVDFVAASSVRCADDARTVRAFLDANGGADIALISKIETQSGVDNAAEIVDVSDGVIVARGDLGVEVDGAKIPHIQKRIVRLCNAKHTPVIIANQMLDSMVRNPRPTRAEAADVANAVYDGADALMLSSETAVGKYPVPSVRMMAKIAAASEPYADHRTRSDVEYETDELRCAPTVGVAAVRTAEAIHATCIVTPTSSGRTARLISNLRPTAPIYAVTQRERVMRRMQLLWGVTPMLGQVENQPMRDTIVAARHAVLSRGLVKPGDLTVFTAGDRATSPCVTSGDVPGIESAPTNVMYVVQIRDERDGETDGAAGAGATAAAQTPASAAPATPASAPQAADEGAAGATTPASTAAPAHAARAGKEA